jgi:predicted permease
MSQIVNAVIPVFAIIGLGWLAGRRWGVSGEAAAILNRFVFQFAVPALIFRLMATAPIREMSWPLLASYFLGQAAVWIAGFAAMALIWRRGAADRILCAMSGGLANHVFLALPLVLWLLGEQGTLPVLMIVTLDSLVIYSLTLVLMEIVTSGGAGHPVRKVAGAYARSPQLIAIVLGLLWAVYGAPLPVPVETATDFLGAAAAPTALFVLGSHLSRAGLSGNRAIVAMVVGLKLVLHPLLVWIVATRVFGLGFEELWVAILVAAAPVGVNGFILAQHYGAFRDEGSAVVAVSTVLSFFTMSAVIWLAG